MRSTIRRLAASAVAVVILLPAMSSVAQVPQSETAAIAAEAWIYAYPMLFNYKSLYEQTQGGGGSNFIGGL